MWDTLTRYWQETHIKLLESNPHPESFFYTACNNCVYLTFCYSLTQSICVHVWVFLFFSFLDFCFLGSLLLLLLLLFLFFTLDIAINLHVNYYFLIWTSWDFCPMWWIIWFQLLILCLVIWSLHNVHQVIFHNLWISQPWRLGCSSAWARSKTDFSLYLPSLSCSNRDIKLVFPCFLHSGDQNVLFFCVCHRWTDDVWTLNTGV